MNDNELREALSDVSHQIWASWMTWMLVQKSHKGMIGEYAFWYQADPDWDRWKLKIMTPYASLSEREKNSDREQADKILFVLDRFNNKRK